MSNIATASEFFALPDGALSQDEVRGLLATIERLTAENEELRDTLADAVRRLTDEIERLTAENEALNGLVQTLSGPPVTHEEARDILAAVPSEETTE